MRHTCNVGGMSSHVSSNTELGGNNVSLSQQSSNMFTHTDHANGVQSSQNSGGGSTQNNGMNDVASDECRRPPFTMHGVLHYLQHEWSRFELERAQWEMERSELRARISFLVGERKGQENLKRDLVRRIKMLEYSLKQERAKLHRLSHGGDELNSEELEAVNSNVPMEIDAIKRDSLPGGGNNAENNSQTWREARQVLRQYLQEIGYSEKILDVRSFRVKNLLGLMPDKNWNGGEGGRKAAEKALLDSEQAILDTADIIQQSRKYSQQPRLKQNSFSNVCDGNVDNDSDSENNDDKNLDVEAVEALGEFSFLQNEKSSTDSGDNGVDVMDSGAANDAFLPHWSSVDSHHNQNAFELAKEDLRSRMEDRKRRKYLPAANKLRSNSAANGGVDEAQELFRTSDENSELSADRDIEGSSSSNTDSKCVSGADLTASKESVDIVDIKDDAAMNEDDSLAGQQQRWELRYTLRSHYDAVRIIQFHPVESMLITASEDGTAKLWDLSTGFMGGLAGKSSLDSKGHQTATGNTDVEPTYTFRGHKGPILAMDMSPTGDMCYTGGYDGSICCWQVPVSQHEVYTNYDANVFQDRLNGHTDCIWGLAFHSSTNRLISASADGTIRVWLADGVAESAQSLVKTFVPPSHADALPTLRPRSIDIVSTEPQQLLTAYSRAQCFILDMESGRNVVTFDFQDGDQVGEVNKILSHPTMPVTITASEDRKIRYFDNNTGKLISSSVAHIEGISSLAIDPNGLYLLSGSNDGSLRLWNMEKRICLQEISAHRKKFDMSVMDVAFHPSRPLIGSVGADSLARVFATGSTTFSATGESGVSRVGPQHAAAAVVTHFPSVVNASPTTAATSPFSVTTSPNTSTTGVSSFNANADGGGGSPTSGTTTVE